MSMTPPHVLVALRRSARLLAKKRREHDLQLLAEETALSSAQRSANPDPRRAGDSSFESTVGPGRTASLSSVSNPVIVAPAPRLRNVARGTPEQNNRKHINVDVGQGSDSRKTKKKTRFYKTLYTYFQN